MLDPIEWDVSVAGFRRGEELTYNDLLYGAMLPSGADATNALAISTAGSFDEFIALMNKKVSDLGLKNTKFSNVVGLYDENNYSSAKLTQAETEKQHNYRNGELDKSRDEARALISEHSQKFKQERNIRIARSLLKRAI